MRKDNHTVKPHIYISRPYHRIFNEKSIWICKIRTGFLQGRGETPREAYENLLSLLSIYRTPENRQLRKILMHGRAYGAGPDSLSKLFNSL
mgnify:CR=1 FL=1